MSRVWSSDPPRRFTTSSLPNLLLAAARQVVIAAAAVAGVLAIAGCSRPPAAASGMSSAPAPVMPSPGNRMPDATLEPSASRSLVPPAYSPHAPHATAEEQRQARQETINRLINEALTPHPMPMRRDANALGVAERAVAPLADTLDAIDAGIRVIVENLRNADTSGYKVSRTAVGDGRDVAMQLDTSPGELQGTNRALDVAIQGDGFLPVRIYPKEQPDGAIAYTRNGMLFMNSTGNIVVGDDIHGYLLVPDIKFPPSVTQITITAAGDVRVSVDRQPQTTSVGEISLALFTDPSALRPLGGGLYGETEASGRAVPTPAGSQNAGRLIQGHLEASNLDLSRERMRLKFLRNWRTSIVAALEDAAAPGK